MNLRKDSLTFWHSRGRHPSSAAVAAAGYRPTAAVNAVTDATINKELPFFTCPPASLAYGDQGAWYDLRMSTAQVAPSGTSAAKPKAVVPLSVGRGVSKVPSRMRLPLLDFSTRQFLPLRQTSL